MSYQLKCCHCRRPARVRTSVEQHALLKIMYVQCLNPACGATFRGQFEYTHAMNTPALANPDIRLPMAAAMMRREAVRCLYGEEPQPDMFEGPDEQPEQEEATTL